MNKAKKEEDMHKIKLLQGDSLIIVDMQKDFMPSGALPVPGADKIVPVLNRYIELFFEKKLLIIASRDWHPKDHCSFRENGGIWPRHCVQGTEGAEFVEALNLPKDIVVVSKGTNPEKEAYSALEETGLSEILKQKGIKRCFVGGVATEYCVFNTVLDLLKIGCETFLLIDAIKSVSPKDGSKAIEKMQDAGAKLIRVEMIE